jgi:Holliday junction resolvasome RuvABC endonuclease subunit
MTAKLIGIDPGLAATGIGVVTGSGTMVQSYAYGVVKTNQPIPPQDAWKRSIPACISYSGMNILI